MCPIIMHFNVGGRLIIIPAYGTVMLFVFVFAGLYLTLVGKRHGITPFYAWLLITMIFAFGHLGAVLWDQLLSLGRMIIAPESTIIGVHPGLAWFGALLFSVPLSYWFIRYNGFSPVKVIDLLTPMLLIGYAIGRMGCLLGGCCYGRPTSLPWGITYPSGIGDGCAPANIALHPTPIYSAVISLIVLIIVLVIRKYISKPGQLFVVAAALHAAGRFVVEFYRWDHGTILLGLNLTQVVSLFVCIISLSIFIKIAKSKTFKLTNGSVESKISTVYLPVEANKCK